MLIEMDKICNELLEVLCKHRIPVHALDRVLANLKELALLRTPIQNVDLEAELSLELLHKE